MAVIRIRDYAKARGVTTAAIYKAIDGGLIERRGRGQIERGQADATWFRRHQQNGAVRQQTRAAEARRVAALLQMTAAKIAMTRRRVEQLRARLVERDRAQAAINVLVTQLYAGLPSIADNDDPADAAVLREAVAIIAADLGDLHAEALKVTQRAP